jgi:hypothetical protein
MLRTNISVAAVEMQDDLGWSDGEKNTVLSVKLLEFIETSKSKVIKSRLKNNPLKLTLILLVFRLIFVSERWSLLKTSFFLSTGILLGIYSHDASLGLHHSAVWKLLGHRRGVALPSLLTMLVPVAAENGVLTLATLRALTGAAEASIYPASYDVISRCFPTNECQ